MSITTYVITVQRLSDSVWSVRSKLWATCHLVGRENAMARAIDQAQKIKTTGRYDRIVIRTRDGAAITSQPL